MDVTFYFVLCYFVFGRKKRSEIDYSRVGQPVDVAIDCVPAPSRMGIERWNKRARHRIEKKKKERRKKNKIKGTATIQRRRRRGQQRRSSWGSRLVGQRGVAVSTTSFLFCRGSLHEFVAVLLSLL